MGEDHVSDSEILFLRKPAMNPLFVVLLLAAASADAAADSGSAIVIGGRRELLVDDFLTEKLSGEARLQLHPPVPREIVLKTDAPWEGNACGYPSVFQDGPLYRMYYHAGHYRHGGKPAEARAEHPWLLCYVESADGIQWRRPELGLCEFEGSKKNNIILTPESVAAIHGDPAHTSVFKDANPDCPPDARYKCIIVGKPHGLYVLKSADGIRFSIAGDKPVITQAPLIGEPGLLGSGTPGVSRVLAHVHGGRGRRPDLEARRLSRDPYRHLEGFPELGCPGGPAVCRFARRAPLHQPDSAVPPAPHIFLGFPMRYTDRGWSDSMLALPGLEERLARAKAARVTGPPSPTACS